MGVALVLLSAVAYGLITAFILTIINEIAILIHVGAVLEQPFIVKILTTLHLSVDSFSAACVWTVLLYVAFIVLFQLPPVQSLQLKFKNIYEPEGELGDFLYDCWDDVCERAGVNPDKYRLYIQASPEINAFALGHNRVVVLAGLINALTYDELRGVLAHELSHIIHRDTTYGMTAYAITTAYNFVLRIFNLLIIIFSVFSAIVRFIPLVNLLALVFSLIIAAITFVIHIMQSVVNFSFVILAPFGSRINEYRADRFAYEIGLGRQLASALDKLSRNGDVNGFFARLFSDHPPLRKRVQRLMELERNK